MSDPEKPRELRRQLGLASATALIVGEVIAIGIFLTPAEMAKSLGSPFWLLLVWLAMGLMALCGALSYGELAARFPQAGGGYVYLREAYGEQLAFLYGWKCFFVMDPGITAALAVGLASYVAYLLNISPPAQKLVAIATILTLAAANILGVQLGARLMRGFTFLKLGLLAFILVWGFLLRLGDWSNFAPFVAQRPGSAPLMGALAGGMVAAFFSFGGWWDVSKLAGEVREAERIVPRALILGVTIVTVVYIITSAAFFYLVPLVRVTSGETFAAQAGEALFGRAGGEIFAGIVIVSVLSSLSGLIMAAPRVYYAMARDGLFLHAAAALHPRFDTPALAIALQAGLASLLVALGTFNQIIAYFIFVTVSFIALTVAAIFALRKKMPSAQGYKTPGYPFTPLLFIALVALLLFLLAAQNFQQAILGVGVVALGWPVYRWVFRKRRKLSATRLGENVVAPKTSAS
ncbi:amino acid permease [candidate division KSB1 bacterium]|nr:amino acid permease [candidate division KSB1 bacterium]